LREKSPVVPTDAGARIDAAAAISVPTRKSAFRAKDDWAKIGDLVSIGGLPKRSRGKLQSRRIGRRWALVTSRSTDVRASGRRWAALAVRLAAHSEIRRDLVRVRRAARRTLIGCAPFAAQHGRDRDRRQDRVGRRVWGEVAPAHSLDLRRVTSCVDLAGCQRAQIQPAARGSD
jgi:hypothetical protein